MAHRKKGGFTRRKILGTVAVGIGTAVCRGFGQGVPEAVVTMMRGFFTGPSVGPAVVGATCVSVVVATSSYVSATPFEPGKPPTVIFRLHPDDERTGP
jgi:hypothetical protein